MAAGMADSTVKVFILSKKQHDVLTVDDMIKEQVEESLKALQESLHEKVDGPQIEEKKENRNLGTKSQKKRDLKNETKTADKNGSDMKQQLSESEIDVGANDDTENYELVGHTGPVFSVAISVCDRHLLSGSYDNTIRRWSL